MSDLGSDFSCFPDMSPTRKVVSGERCLAEHLASRLETPRGGLFYDPNYGTDLRAYVNRSGVTKYQVTSDIQTESLKDERVAKVVPDVTITNTTITARISVVPEDSTLKPFDFTINVSQLTVELVNFSA
jgi:phage baseplate assembly protein W